MSEGLNLTIVCFDVFPRVKQYTVPSDIHSCLFHAITSHEEEVITSRAA